MAENGDGTSGTKLQLNDDGSITVPLKGRSAIRLEEPSAEELAKMHDIVAVADEALTKIPKVSATSPADEIAAALEAANSRAKETFSTTSPHGLAFCEVVNMLHPPAENEEQVTLAVVYGWALNPRACRNVLDHFTAPLGGQAAEADRQRTLQEARALLNL